MKPILILAPLIPSSALGHPWGHDGFAASTMMPHLLAQPGHLAALGLMVAAGLFLLRRAGAWK